jgi:hypothetical protein
VGVPGVITLGGASPARGGASPEKLCFTYTQFSIIASVHIAQAPGFRNGEFILDASMPKGYGFVVTAEFKAEDTEAPQAHTSRKHQASWNALAISQVAVVAPARGNYFLSCLELRLFELHSSQGERVLHRQNPIAQFSSVLL